MGFSILLIAGPTTAQERRSPAPTFQDDQIRGIFFDKLSDAIRGDRPKLSSLRVKTAAASNDTTASPPISRATNNRWGQWIGPAALEDEVKRIKLHFDSVVTTPAAFNSGGFKQARIDLTVLATLFTVISQHSEDVRWKNDALAARDLVARTAFNCKAGSNQVYAEAKMRKADLQDLVSGSGLAVREAAEEEDWSAIADRAPLMQYAESLIQSLDDVINSDPASQTGADAIKRDSQLIAMLGEVLIQAGMEDAGDQDYQQLSRAMSKSAKELTLAVERSDADAYPSAAGNIRKQCDACHEQYR